MKRNSEKHWPSDEELVTWLANGAVDYPSEWNEGALQPIRNGLAALAKVRLRELQDQKAMDKE